MTYELGDNRYGKSRIRLVTVRRGPERHHLRDVTVDVGGPGDLGAAPRRRANTHGNAAATQKNTTDPQARDR
ncbi:MAG TPA: hypothetical protein VK831_02740, partial [Candidatus Deferrimicrobiaceae bacterium]|nr:hypothetical protein [Candidatus Deferrimicrobiaceae bacterium]